MHLVTTTNVSVDGVMQGLGGPEEDPSGGFERGGWAMPLFDTEMEKVLGETYGGAAAYLFGRWTFETFARSWGAIPEMMSSPIGTPLNERPKYVVSSTLVDPGWAGTTILNGDLAEAIRDLKAGPEGELLVPGSLRLVRWLIENELVDQIELHIFPVVVGQGRRLFPDAGLDIALELISSRTSANGVTTQRYRPAGRPSYALPMDAPNDRERNSQ